MSGGASATGQRRCPQGLEDATNKKRQKDRMNQESKDGEPKRGGNQTWEMLLCPPKRGPGNWAASRFKVVFPLPFSIY